MDLRQLRHFTALAQHLNYHQAAEMLGISQPTLTQHILALEAEIGASLFDRTKRSVRLSAAGSVYLVEAQALLAQSETAKRHAQEASGGIRGALVIAASGPAVMGDLPSVFRAFRQRFESVSLRLRMMRSREIAEAVLNREVHIGIGRPPPASENLVSFPLWDHAVRVVLPVRHRLASESVIDLAQLSGEVLVLQPRSSISGMYDHIISLVHDRGFLPSRIEEVDSIDASLGLVSCEIGVVVIPEPWERVVLQRDVVFRPIADSQKWRFPISIYWHIDDDSELVKRFVSVARETAQLTNTSPPKE